MKIHQFSSKSPGQQKPPTDSTGPAILPLPTPPSGLFVNSRREEQKEQLLRQIEAVIRSNRTIYRDNLHLAVFALTCTWKKFDEVLHDNLLPEMRDAFFLIDGTTAAVGNLSFMIRCIGNAVEHIHDPNNTNVKLALEQWLADYHGGKYKGDDINAVDM